MLLCASCTEPGGAGARWEPAPGKGDRWQLCSPCRASTSSLGEAAALQAGEEAGSLSADGIRAERANTPVSAVMKGDGQVITKATVINHQLRGFIQSLDTPEDTRSAADAATGVSCNVRLSNQSGSTRQDELAAHVCASQPEDAMKKEISAGYKTASPAPGVPGCFSNLFKHPAPFATLHKQNVSTMGFESLDPRWGNGKAFGVSFPAAPLLPLHQPCRGRAPPGSSCSSQTGSCSYRGVQPPGKQTPNGGES